MKNLASIFIVIYLFAFTGCTENLSTKPDPTNLNLPDSPPVLEISQDAQGAWDITGETLFLSLYENGVAEFEVADAKKKVSGNQSNAAEVNVLKRVKISEKDLKRFTDLINSEDFQAIKDSYHRKCCCTDATTAYKINFQSAKKQRNLSLIGYCGFNELIKSRGFGDLAKPGEGYHPDFPVVISDLMILVSEIRAKY